MARGVAVEYPFAEETVARYDALAGAQGNGAVDAQTAQDMLLPSYLAALGAGASIFGRQMLYRRLWRGCGAEALSSARDRIGRLLADGAARERMAAALQPLRRASAEVSAALYALGGEAGSPLPPVPHWPSCLWLLPLAFLATVVAGIVWLPGLALAVLLSIILIALQVSHQARMQQWGAVVEALQLQLLVHSQQADAPGAQQAAKLRRQLAPSAAESIPGIAEYANWLMQANLKRYYKTHSLVREHAAFLRESFVLVADLDADLALARHLAGQQRWCWAEEGWEQEIQLQAVRHPLLAEAQALDLALEGTGAFISGQNGIGKSTLLRTVGLNLLTARAFGFCYALQARVPNLPVFASMQNEDALADGESLYQAELRRAHELLSLSRQPQRAVYIIDEIFRGTNHMESVSAAAAVLDELAARGTVLVSSHNVVLARLLDRSCVPLLVQKRGDGLVLTPGVLTETNGLALLAQSGFDPAIERRAREVYKSLTGRLLQA